MFRLFLKGGRGIGVSVASVVLGGAQVHASSKSKTGLYCFPESDNKEVGKCIPSSAFRVTYGSVGLPDMLCAFVDHNLRIERILKPQDQVDFTGVLDPHGDWTAVSSDPGNPQNKDQIVFDYPTLMNVVRVQFPEPHDAIAACEVWVASDPKLTSWSRVNVVGSLEAYPNCRTFDVPVEYPVYGLRVKSPDPKLKVDLTKSALFGRPLYGKC